jgi:hypothetical protein
VARCYRASQQSAREQSRRIVLNVADQRRAGRGIRQRVQPVRSRLITPGHDASARIGDLIQSSRDVVGVARRKSSDVCQQPLLGCEISSRVVGEAGRLC